MPHPVLHQINVLGSVLSSTLGAWRGAKALVSSSPQPALPLRLYDMEGCPYCRAVREVLTALHLDAEILPCPKGGTRFRLEAERLAGRQQFPLFVDMNTGAVMYESADIVDYLFKTYGNGRTPSAYSPSLLKTPLTMLAGAVRGLRGIDARPSHMPVKPLQLWSFEASPYSRLVRERLTELELSYVLHNVGKERWQDIGPAVLRLKPGPYEPIVGGKRDAHFRRYGHMQLPYLEDPNTGAALLESAAIIDYLESTYAL